MLQKFLEMPNFASRSSEASHSIGFFPVLSLKMEKKPFRSFKLNESGLVSKQKIETEKKILAQKQARI